MILCSSPNNSESLQAEFLIAYQQFIDGDNPNQLLQWLIEYQKIIVQYHIAPIVNILALNLTHEVLQKRRSEGRQLGNEGVNEVEIWRGFSDSLPRVIGQIIELSKRYSSEMPETVKANLKTYILSQLEELRITPNLLFTQPVATIAYPHFPMNAVPQAVYYLVNGTIH